MSKDKEHLLRLREPDITPTNEVLGKVLGNSYKAYIKLQEALPGLDIEHEWKYYPSPMCGKCWLAQGKFRHVTPRGAKKEKTIYWSSAWDKYFVVAIWFKEDNRAEILKADVSDETKQLIRNGKMFGPKMRTFPVEFEVTSGEQIADVCTLIQCKKRLEA